jgi:hypothetical protein
MHSVFRNPLDATHRAVRGDPSTVFGVPLAVVHPKAIAAIAHMQAVAQIPLRSALVAVVAVRPVWLVPLARVSLLVGPLAVPAVPAVVPLTRRVLLRIKLSLALAASDQSVHAVSLYVH